MQWRNEIYENIVANVLHFPPFFFLNLHSLFHALPIWKYFLYLLSCHFRGGFLMKFCMHILLLSTRIYVRHVQQNFMVSSHTSTPKVSVQSSTSCHWILSWIQSSFFQLDRSDVLTTGVAGDPKSCERLRRVDW